MTRERYDRKPRLRLAKAEQRRGIFGGRGTGLAKERVVQRHQTVLIGQRLGIIPRKTCLLELAAKLGRDIGGDRYATASAMRHEAQSGRILARQTDEVF